MGNEGGAPNGAVATGAQPQGGQSPENNQGGQPKQPAQGKAAPKFSSKIEETLWRVNEPGSDGLADSDPTPASMGEITDRGQAAANLSSKDANTDPKLDDPRTKAEDPEPKVPSKKKYTVKFGEKAEEYELDPETADRFTQKGIYYEKKNQQIVQREKVANQTLQEANAAKAEAQQILKVLQDPENALVALEELHGPEKARQLMEKYLRPKIERELMPPEQREQLEWKERAERAERQLQQHNEKTKEAELNQQTEQLKGRYEQQIMQALEKGGVPKTNYTAAEMADLMLVSPDAPPEKLAQVVEKRNQQRTAAWVDKIATQIHDARKAGDINTVVSLGQKLESILGEQAVYAIGKYLVSRPAPGQNGASNGKQNKPVSQFDAPKVKFNQEEESGKKMTEEEYAAKRKRIAAAIDRGENVPESW